MSSILESVRNISESKYDNIDANLAVNELAKIQENCYVLEQDFRFTPEMVPIVKNESAEEGQPKYCIDGECFQKMLKSNDLSEEDINYLYSIFDINNRVYYDNIALPNISYGGSIATNVGNPLREYISLEACRAIKDMVINKEKNKAYWEERIIRDVVEYTETSAKIRQLYKR